MQLETATAREVRGLVERWTLRADFASTPLGEAFIASGPRGVVRLSFPAPDQRESEWRALAQAWPGVPVSRDAGAAAALAGVLFAPPPGARRDRPIRVFVNGTPFQLRVWRALVGIPCGSTRTYGAIAREIGAPGSARAVGTAVAGNPVAVLIPCHRVLPAGGGIGNYRWGARLKHALLEWERAR